MKKPKKEHPIDKEIRETVAAMVEGLPAGKVYIIGPQLRRMIRVCFQLGGEYALRNPELAKDWLAKNKRKTMAKNWPMKDDQT